MTSTLICTICKVITDYMATTVETQIMEAAAAYGNPFCADVESLVVVLQVLATVLV